MRCKTTFDNEVKKFIATNQNDIITTIYPSPDSIKRLREHGYIITKETRIRVRMVRIILADGETEVLLTDLYDDKIFTLKKNQPLIFYEMEN